MEERKKFEEDLNKLLDIAHPNLEKTLAEDRLRREETESEQETEVETETEIIYEEDKLELLQRFCVYTVQFYIPFFLTANNGADAAITNLSL